MILKIYISIPGPIASSNTDALWAHYAIFLPPYGSVCNVRNKKQCGASRISQSLVGPLLGRKWKPAWQRVPSNGPTSDCEMQLAPNCLSFLKWWMYDMHIILAMFFLPYRCTPQVSHWSYADCLDHKVYKSPGNITCIHWNSCSTKIPLL